MKSLESRVFLSEKKIDNWKQEAILLTHEAMAVGDLGQRRRTKDALISIQHIMHESRSADDVFQSLVEIVERRDLPLLPKIHAVMAIVDFTYRRGSVSESQMSYFADAIQSNNHSLGSTILTGAYLARDIYNLVDEEQNGAEWWKVYDRRYKQLVDSDLAGISSDSYISSEQESRFKKAVQCRLVAQEIMTIVNDEGLVMRLPQSIIIGSKQEKAPTAVQVGKKLWPTHTVHLMQGNVPKNDKVETFVSPGMPVSHFILRPTSPRMRVGAEVRGARVLIPSGGRMRTARGRRFVYVEFGGLHRPDGLAEEVLSYNGVYPRQKIIDSATLDSFSFIGAVRVGDAVIDNRIKRSRWNQLGYNEKVGLVRRKTQEFVNWLSEERFGLFDYEGNKVGTTSLLKVALEESQRNEPYGNVGWDIIEARMHLTNTISALVLCREGEEKGGRVLVRDRDALAQLFLDYVWTRMFDEDDLFELGLALCQDQNNPVWRQLDNDDEVAEEIALAASSVGVRVSSHSRSQLIHAVLRARNDVQRLRLISIASKVLPDDIELDGYPRLIS